MLVIFWDQLIKGQPQAVEIEFDLGAAFLRPGDLDVALVAWGDR